MSEITVLLVEDFAIVRQGFHSLLAAEDDIKVIGEAGDGHEAIEKVEQSPPDVVIMDLTMPRLNGLEATRRIKKRFPEVEVLILSRHSTEEYVIQALQAGASGYLLKSSAVQDLLSAVRSVAQGDSYMSPAISRKVIDDYVRRAKEMVEPDVYDTLTSREREVLQLIAEGHSTSHIAELLSISSRTVRSHRANLMEKLDLYNTAELVCYAARKGIIDIVS